MVGFWNPAQRMSLFWSKVGYPDDAVSIGISLPDRPLLSGSRGAFELTDCARR
jgi:hypothetical protein